MCNLLPFGFQLSSWHDLNNPHMECVCAYGQCNGRDVAYAQCVLVHGGLTKECSGASLVYHLFTKMIIYDVNSGH